MTRSMPDTDRLPHALYRAEQVRNLDRTAIEEFDIPGIELMNRAGAVAYRILRDRWPAARRVTILTGIGNNGGDGYVIARLARAGGLSVRVLQLGDAERLRGDAAVSAMAYRNAGGAIEPFQSLPRDTDVYVDALFGTGLERTVEGPWAETIEALNAQRAPVLAVDMPSGLHADSGRVLGVAAKASATVSFIGLKQGLFIGAGPEYRGDLHFTALEVPSLIYSREILSLRRVDWVQQLESLKPRSRVAHKGNCGHVLLIGGAPGLSGAIRLAGEAALRAGAGLVTIATHPQHAGWLNLTRPELMVAGIELASELAPLIERADVIAIGPGLGRGDWGRQLWEQVRDLGRPLVVDADALNLLAELPVNGPDWVLTPHSGEAARLLQVEVAEVEHDRLQAVRVLQERYGGTAVLKGAGSLVLGGSHRPPAVCSDGNPGMATAGSGDVLTGIIAALRGQGMDPEEAATAGVCLHAAAGDQAACQGERGLIASDIIASLRPLANGVEVA
ncbi:NAD(P)H-hydrate dehydratase [Thiocystis violacea]|uniref:NAD(P)H-hydrate dehydratase n=1 Tax=Thiocystis violacea TaxID=13725 RepID=UPI001908CE8B|nr:NAD(P)H-hydrate dehydratase [Thiocystis violacea]MBK1720642.1 bifunctional ADP-dependent NAD(P)H-hydrate dehydratase/NAD(P)H-hydrate epimerase [Thiocystis violacea]